MTIEVDEDTPKPLWERFQKPPRGEHVVKRKGKRAKLRTKEDEQKDIVRLRDKRCRWPRCHHTSVGLQVAHLEHKSMGGNPAGDRSQAPLMILLCALHHQGGKQNGHPEGSLDGGDLRIEPETLKGTVGACAFYRRGNDGDFYLVARELAPFVYEKD